MISNMRAILLVRTRIVYSDRSFAELVLWRLQKSVPGPVHTFKYRLAYIVDAECVVRYDNEAGKGDHRRYGTREASYRFRTPEILMADFQKDISRWNDENSGS